MWAASEISGPSTSLPGSGRVFHWDGRAWAQVASGRGLAGGSALSDSDVRAFHGTDVARWTGSAWH